MAVSYKNGKKTLTAPVDTGDRNFSGSYTPATGTPTIKTPPSISNPASLTPGATPPAVTPQKTFSDNIAKPILPTPTPTPTTSSMTPTGTPAVPTTPPVTPTTPVATGSTVAPSVGAVETPVGFANGFNPSEDISDPNNFYGTGYTYDQWSKLSDADKQTSIGTVAKYIEGIAGTDAAMKFMEDNKAQTDYLNKQTNINSETTRLNNENANQLRNQQMRAEEKSVRDLAQNIGFLGSGGRPVQSAGMMHAYADAINESNTKLNEIKMIQENQRTMEKLGIEFDANAYAENIRKLTQDLNNNVSKVQQEAITAYQNQLRNGSSDTVSKRIQLQQDIISRLDTSVGGFVQKNLDAIKMMNDSVTNHIEAVKVETARAEKLADEERKVQQEFTKQQNIVNKDMSKALGHYVNGNGQALTTIEGGIIPFVDDMPNPSYDPNTGTAVIRQPDAQGNPVPVIQQIAPMSEDYKLGLQLKQAQLGKLQQGDKATYTFDDNGDGTYTRKGNDGSLSVVNTTGDPITTTTTKGVPISDAIAVALEKCKTGAQCGKFVNDILEEAGMGRLVQNSYLSKEQAIDKVGVALSNDQIGAGSIFAYPIDKKKDPNGYGHIGIVTAVNGDGTINIMDFNANKDEKKREVLNYNPDKVRNAGGTYSVPIISNQTVQPTKKDKPLSDKQFTQSNQIINSFKGDPQVKAFEEAYANGVNLLSSLNDASGPGDVAGVFQFMKTLDPTSTVREGEYATAAKSAGVWEQFKNIPANKLEGAVLSPSQRIAFGKLAKKFIENKSTLYETKYKDGIRRLETQKIDTSVFPTNIANDMKQYLNGEQSTSTSAKGDPLGLGI